MNPSLVKKIGFAVLVVIIIAGCSYILGGGNGNFSTALVERRDLTTEVLVTGNVVPADRAQLAFENSGRITDIPVSIGQEISAGDTLLILDNADLKADLAEANARLQSQRAQLLQYQARVRSEEAKLEELRRGTRAEELSVAETAQENAKKVLTDKQKILREQIEITESKLTKDQKAVSDAQENYDNIVEQNQVDMNNLYQDIYDLSAQALNTADYAVRVQTSEIFFGNRPENRLSQLSRGTVYELSFDVQIGYDLQVVDASNKKKSAIGAIIDWSQDLDRLNSESPQADLETLLKNSQSRLKIAEDFLRKTKDLLAVAFEQEDLSRISQYRINVNDALNQINDALEDITEHQQLINSQKITNQNRLITAQEKLNNAQNTLDVTRLTTQQDISSAEAQVNEAENQLRSSTEELLLKQAGSREEQITAQEAIVAQEEASLAIQQARIQESLAEVQRRQAEVDKTVLKSPIDGIVSRLEPELGEIVGSNEVVAAVLSQAAFEIEANVPEIHIANIKVGQEAEITLDSYGNDIIFTATVIHIDPAETLVEDVPNYEITLQFAENDDRIRSGMTANVFLETQRQEDVLVVPLRAVYSENGEFRVERLIEKDQRESVIIESDFLSTDGFRNVLSGLEEGDTVVIPYE